MAGGEQTDVTRLLERADLDPDERAGLLLPVIYEQLRSLARQLMAAERPGHTLQATILVHEAYLRLVGERRLPWANRAHFFKAAAQAMRRILLDHAKARGRNKRGGGRKRVALSAADFATQSDPEDFLSLDEAIDRLCERDPAIAEVVRMRFYAGLSIEETAAALQISPATVKRRWEFARTWLYRELNGRTEEAM